MGGSALTNWAIFGNAPPETEAVKLAPNLVIPAASDTTRLLRKGWSPNAPGAYCKRFTNMTEADVRKVFEHEPTAVDYIPEFVQRYP